LNNVSPTNGLAIAPQYNTEACMKAYTVKHKIVAGENFGEFDELNVISQHFA